MSPSPVAVREISPMGWTLAQASDPASPLMMGGNSAASATGTTQAPGAGAPAGGTQQAPPGLGPIIWLLPLLLLFFILMTGSTQRREKKRVAAMMSNLKKQDKVLTIGGIIGTVAEIRDDEVVLKVDENSNTRMRFTRNAIQQVLKASDNASAAAPGNGSEPKIEVKAGKGERATV